MVYNRRSVTHKLILSLLIICISVSPVFANVNVEIEYNDNEYFHAYNSNTNVANSYIDSGASVFSKAMNYMFINIAKSTSSVYSINGIVNNLYTRVGDLMTNMTNNNTLLINAVNSYYTGIFGTNGIAQNIATAKGYLQTIDSVTQDMRNSFANIEWLSLSDGQFVDSSLNTITSQTDVNSPYNYYFRFNFASNNNLGVIKVDLPVFSNGRTARIFDFKFYDINGSGQYAELDMKYVYVYNINKQSLELYITNFSYNYSDMLIRIIPNSGNYRVYPSRGMKSYYISSTKEDYLKVADFMYLNSIDSKLDNINISASLDDSGIIDAINNLSLQDNDVKLNLTINNNTGSDGTDIITRLQNFFNTGVSVNDFFDNVDDAESGWFTQSNSDVINTLRGGYTNFYE